MTMLHNVSYYICLLTGSQGGAVPANQRPDSASGQRLPPKINAVHPKEEDATSVVSAKSKGRGLFVYLLIDDVTDFTSGCQKILHPMGFRK